MTKNSHITNPINRRQALAGAGAAAGALAIAGPALASGESDAELRALWGRYVTQYRVYKEAEKVAHETRAKFDAAHPEMFNPDPNDEMLSGDRWAALGPERIKYGVDVASNAWTREHTNLISIVTRIRKAKAETMFGVGVKLVASKYSEEYDFIEAIVDALRQISVLTGTNFLADAGDDLIKIGNTVGHGDIEISANLYPVLS